MSASASLGFQGIVGKRSNTRFTTTASVVPITVRVELFTDPSLFDRPQRMITREHKLIATSSPRCATLARVD
ncbi:hypothetical protein PM082_023187 [Marasmius tenuissimus]|nr:hypothetical protein PM082_023187 [Marasmius tenuissimus]